MAVWDNLLLTNNGMTINEDAGLTSLSNTMLKAYSISGPDNNIAPSQANSSEMTFELTSIANLNGILKNNATTLVLGSTFTQANIDNGDIKYQPNAEYNNQNNSGNYNYNGDGNTVVAKADFSFKVTGSNQYGTDTSLNHTFYINVIEQNDVPINNVLLTLPVVEDTATTITNQYLEYVEKTYNNMAPNESNNNNIQYTVTDITNLHGSLTNNGSALNDNSGSDTFTQSDINNNKIVYTPSGNFNEVHHFHIRLGIILIIFQLLLTLTVHKLLRLM